MTENQVPQPHTQEILLPEIGNQQSLGSVALTDLERSHVASRILHDAELIKDGATINTNGVIEPTEEQINNLYAQDILMPQEAEFRETPSGKAIQVAAQKLRELSRYLHGELGHAVEIKIGEKSVFGNFDPKAWLARNKFDIDIDKFSSERDAPYNPDSYSMQVLGQIDSDRAELHNLKYKMIQHPQIRLDSEVSVMRNGKNGAPNYEEAGWIVHGVLADGRLEVVSPDGKASKSVTAAQLLKLNS